jgi:Zn-dependent oligopeptidase
LRAALCPVGPVPSARRRLTAFAFAFSTCGAFAASAALPTMPLHTADEIPKVCDAGLERAKEIVGSIEAVPLARADARTVLRGFNRLHAEMENVESVVYLLNNVSPDKAVRDAAEPCLLKYNEFSTDLMQNPKLYARVKAVNPSSPADRKFRKDMLDSFEDTGVALPEAKRARMKEIIQKLEEARQEFERNIRDNKNRVTMKPDEMKGLPASYLEKAKRDEQGNYLLGFEYPEYFPFMTNADDEEARRRYQFEFTNRGGMRNMEVLDDVIKLRREMAELFGMKSYAQFSLRRKMAGTPQAAKAFLDGVKAQVREVARKDIAELTALKAQMLGKPAGEVKLNNWDSAYYRDKLRKARYNIDREALRAYFPTDASIEWVMHISSVLYGVEFRPASIPAWHSEVKTYAMHDATTKAFIATLYLDLFPRDGKFGHAANFGVQSASTLERRAPISVLVANLDRKGLDNTEIETLVHEFGHTLHHMLSRTPYVFQSGSGLEWDFVEAPSQMYEEWGRRKESLSLLSRFCGGCKPVDDDLVRRLEAARKVGMGLRYLDQHLLADYDLTLYGDTPVDPGATWARMEGATLIGHTPGTIFPSSFEHIIRGYAAGYYGYMWSEVLALDMLSKYGNNIMNPKVGRRFRDTVLAHGGERPASQMVREFLGRKPNNAAFIAEITGTRKSN